MFKIKSENKENFKKEVYKRIKFFQWRNIFQNLFLLREINGAL